MKRIKKILLLFLIIMLSGCSVEYDLNINEDSSVNEKVVAKELTNRMKSNTGVGEKQSVNYLYDMFNRKSLKTKIYSKKDGDTTVATVTGNHKSLKAYSKNFTSDVFEDVIVNEEGNKVTLIFNQTKVLSSTSSRGLIYDDITVNIIVPFKVLESNADNYHRDVYTWNIKKDEDLRQLKITYDKTNLKYSKLFNIGDFKLNVEYSYIALIIMVGIVITIIIIVYVNNKKNNKI